MKSDDPQVFFNKVKEICQRLDEDEQPGIQPIAWGMLFDDGQIYDCITPKEHNREEGEYVVPLFTLDALSKMFEAGRHRGMKQERALWHLSQFDDSICTHEEQQAWLKNKRKTEY